MSSFVHHAPRWSAVPRPSLAGSAVAIAKAVLSWPARVHASRALLNQLAGMSVSELADIGLTPGDVQDTAALPLHTEIGSFLATRVSSRRRLREAR